MTRHRVSPHSRIPLLALVAVVSLTLIATTGARAADPLAGSQGTDTSLPATDSQVTVHGRGAFADLAITINQTANLGNQAVSLKWTGGAPTISIAATFEGNFLQVMQCWGDDDGTNPDNPGPPPEQCVQGAIGSIGDPPASVYPGPDVVSRRVGLVGWPNLDPNVFFVDQRSSYIWRKFRAVNGTVVNVQKDPTVLAGDTGNSWLNPYFNAVTTNEIAGAKTSASGTGADLFEVHTGLESSGLGCGQSVQPTAAGNKVPQCWIVIVPRADAATENADTPYATDTERVQISPLAPQAWKNRIAVPISFNPVDSPCPLGADERRIAGSELLLPAIANWQPALCTGGDLPPYAFAPVSDASARQQLASSTPGGPGMVVVSKPLASTLVDAKSPVVYAPLTVSGLAIGFNVERTQRDSRSGPASPEAQALVGVRYAEMNLTPRLVAKLLTQSYKGQLTIAGKDVPAAYTWVTNNPNSMGDDPDFIRFNPEFANLTVPAERTFGGLQLPSGTSDAAERLWQWVLADPEAKAWMDGTADEFGMKVNPVYSTNSQLNPSGFPFGTPMPTTFPKADPYCYQGAENSTGVVPPLLCGTDWMPYQRNYTETAKAARIAFDGARVGDNTQAALNSADVWKRLAPQTRGQRMMLSLTDTPSAARYGLQVARLSRAGDNGSDRKFIAADSAGLLAGVATMTPGEEPQVLEPNPATVGPDAYPLTMVTYAAIKPLSLDAQARSDYAAFLEYASIPGQVSGLEPGELPRGYAPLPTQLQAQTLLDSVLVEALQPPPPDPEPTTTVLTTVADSTTTTAASTTSTSTTVAATTTATPTTQQVEPPDEPSVNAAPPTTARRATPTATAPIATLPSATIPVVTEAPVTSVAPASSEVPVTSVAPATTAAPTIATTTTEVTTAITPIVDLAKSRFAVPGIGALAIGSALGALEITKRSRRAPSTDVEDGEVDADQAGDPNAEPEPGDWS